jgi:hypothetical protein
VVHHGLLGTTTQGGVQPQRRRLFNFSIVSKWDRRHHSRVQTHAYIVSTINKDHVLLSMRVVMHFFSLPCLTAPPPTHQFKVK